MTHAGQCRKLRGTCPAKCVYYLSFNPLLAAKHWPCGQPHVPGRTFLARFSSSGNTGPGYDTSAFAAALASGGDVDESRCGRVYVQGLNEANDPRIALLFDKVAAPNDHCHFPHRLWAGFVREVRFVDATSRAVPVEQWSAFAKEQIDILVAAGLTREQAQQLYAEVK